MIRSTASNLPIYVMSMFRMPKMVARQLKKINFYGVEQS